MTILAVLILPVFYMFKINYGSCISLSVSYFLSYTGPVWALGCTKWAHFVSRLNL